MVQKERLVTYLITSPSHPISPSRKEAVYGKELILADRDMVETQSDDILHNADNEDVCLLVVGDPFGCVPHLFFISFH